MLFDESYYFKRYPDIKEAVAKGSFRSGTQHYEFCGQIEGRTSYNIVPMAKPKIVLYTLTKNEEFIMPFFLSHYLLFVDKIIVYDNNSTDKTRDIISSYPNTEIRHFNTNNITDDSINVEIKNTCYKEQRGEADFVIVCDADEFLYADTLRELLITLAFYKATGITMIDTIGYDMVSKQLPRHDEHITQIRDGMPSDCYSKNIIFDPEIDICYSAGSHSCLPKSDNIVVSDTKLSVLHYKYLSFEYVTSKAKKIKLSKYNIDLSLGMSWLTPAGLVAQYNLLLMKGKQVIDGWKESDLVKYHSTRPLG